MLLSSLLKGVNVVNEYRDIEIKDVTANSNSNMEGAAFVCIKGNNADGHDFAAEAVKKGAAAVICQRHCCVDGYIMVEDTAAAYGIICDNFFQNSSKELKLIGVTGTNGKTSVATIIRTLLCACDMPCGLISTIEAEYGEKTEEVANTTPEPYSLHRLFYNMTKDGMKVVSMEASSHALNQKRLSGLNFSVAVFTNLTQDHLDYHKSMLEYYKAKKKLFSITDYAVVNIDDVYGRVLAAGLCIEHDTFSVSDRSADYFADDISCRADGVSFMLCHNCERVKVRFAIPGIYSVKNAMAAIIACHRFGISLNLLADEISNIEGIKGRSELIKTSSGFSVVCDYAHTPDGIENILKSTRQYAQGRIVLLFGCGGDRDREKRPIMGRIAAELADFVVVTSDNPRTEPPDKIISEILAGMMGRSNYIAVPDRREAVKYALATAKRGDIVILAGKGHEMYQILGDKKIYFDERRLVKGILRNL